MIETQANPHDGDMLAEMPIGLRGVMIAGLFAAAMTGIDSALNATVSTSIGCSAGSVVRGSASQYCSSRTSEPTTVPRCPAGTLWIPLNMVSGAGVAAITGR